MTSKTGPYAIINQKSGTALTVSDGRLRAITCSPYDQTENQKFYLVALKNGLELRTSRAEECVGVPGDIRPNSELFAIPGATMAWFLARAPVFGPKCYYIRSFEEQDLGMSLADGGSLDPGTPVKLETISDAPHQVWELRT